METKTHSRYDVARKALLFWCLFIGIGAVAGATGMLVASDGSALGMDAMLPFFQVLPFADVLFQDFVFSGIALLVVNGLTNLTAAAFLIAKKRVGVTLAGLFGVTLMLWICIQFVIFPPNFMSTIYFIFGFAQAATGYAARVFMQQERFTVRREDYPGIGQNEKELVVYFSRMGYVKKLAFETAAKLGAQVYEIRATEPTAGTPGFWWCGRFAMHGWDMPIVQDLPDLTRFDRVTICSPIWAFSLAAPVRTFLKEAAGRIRRADYVLVHHTNGAYTRVADEMDALLGVQRGSLTSVRCHMGTFRTCVSAPQESNP